MTKLPESNASIVAHDLVFNAMVDDVTNPGEALALLFEKMAVMARNIGGEYRAARADGEQLLSAADAEIEATIRRQEFAFGESWAQRWMLCLMTKCLYGDLERDCLNSPAASAIASVKYADDGTVETWRIRRRDQGIA